MLVTEKREPELYDALLERNLVRQYDLLTNFIEIGIVRGPEAFDKYMLWSLNHAAVAGISQFGGRFREEPIYVGDHIPPHFSDVPDLMDRFVSFIHENWDNMTPTQLSAYGLWRLNWVHPFIEGNGRTARAVCYYLMSVKVGELKTTQPNTTTIEPALLTSLQNYFCCVLMTHTSMIIAQISK